MLTVQSLSFSYIEKKEILNNISFEITQGKHLALVGESGSGKSTLLKLIYGLLAPKQGKLSWNDTPILGPHEKLIPGQPFMSFVTQESHVSNFKTVAENILEELPRDKRQKSKKKLLKMLRMVNLETFKDVKIETLSGGQRQRLAIAKAVSKRPKILLLDEPFSHIDSFQKYQIRDRLYTYLKKKKTTIITATHDRTDILGFSDSILALDQGKCIAYKPTMELYRNPDNYRVARLLDQAQWIDLKPFISDLKTSSYIIIYPHEIVYSISQNSPNAKVISTHFIGNCYRIKALLNQQLIFFNHHTHLDPNKQIQLELLPYTLCLKNRFSPQDIITEMN